VFDRVGGFVTVDVAAQYRSFGPMVLRRCRALLRDEHAAVDAMHDVFVQLLRHGGRLDGSRPASLLLRIATNVCLNRIRSTRRRPYDTVDARVLAIAAATRPEASWMARLHLGTAFRSELSSTRVMAVLHHVDGLTLEEVAREVGMSVSGVGRRLRGLRARLEALEGTADAE
jgi:RNA polymerase sigma-70 factor (ECF subfamily)